jgi:anthranilate/para-aminobenzoate synthase component I
VLHRGCLVGELADEQVELLLHESAAWPPVDHGEIVDLLAAAAPVPDPEEPPPAEVEDEITQQTFESRATRCLEHIAVGDIYQVQIGHELVIRSPMRPLSVYQRLRRRNASPFMYLTTLGEHTVIGASPELFVRVEDGAVLMRPIAGTVPRGAIDDEVGAVALRNDPKELAEHTMLVDLCRNDIGRICQPDTLDVPEHFTVERYSHVQHLVSTVVGRAESAKDSYDIIPALFPAGTMTGAPKIRAMEIIETMESSRRGLYAGALGLIDVGGYLNLALCIRTLINHNGAYRTRASAGIVADSDPAREWAETLAKANAAHWAVTGKELL